MTKLIKFLKKGKYEKKQSIVRNTYAFFHKRKFGAIGKGSYIWKPLFLSGTRYYYLGNNVEIWPGVRIEAIDEWEGERFTPKLEIGNNVIIGQDCHITLAERIIIEDNVLCTSRVTITDISHVTEDKRKAVVNQAITTNPTRICEGAFIGVNAVIFPGVTIGKHAVVGANSIVSKDVPDYGMVAAAPAKEIWGMDD